jgi:ubiquinone/menaquinone biosynthesis C-methylase UbiE
MKEYVAIVERIAVDAPEMVLDWGCGRGQITSLMRERGIMTAAFDYHPELGDGQLHPLESYPDIEVFLSDDGVTLPYEDNSFDAALSCGVLEHVQDPDASLDELRRVLRPGSMLYVYKLPNRASWSEWVARRLGGRVFYHGMAAYDQLYDLVDARALLERHGFRVIESRYTTSCRCCCRSRSVSAPPTGCGASTGD